MPGGDGKSPGDPSKMFLEHLEKSGFFQQIQDLEGNLRKISEDLKNLGETATQRLEETESLAAHVLAIESILTVMLKNNPVNDEELTAAITQKTTGLAQENAGNSAVRKIAENISTGKPI